MVDLEPKAGDSYRIGLVGQPNLYQVFRKVEDK